MKKARVVNGIPGPDVTEDDIVNLISIYNCLMKGVSRFHGPKIMHYSISSSKGKIIRDKRICGDSDINDVIDSAEKLYKKIKPIISKYEESEDEN